MSIDAPFESTTLSLSLDATSLTAFYTDNNDNGINYCTLSAANSLYYHNGSSLLPIIGDTIYSNSSGTLTVVGGDFYRAINTTYQGSPAGASGTYITINSSGVVTNKGNVCACNETAIPIISQDDITVELDNAVDIKIACTNNPYAWEVITTCVQWELTGGIDGSVYTYTNCNNVFKRIVVSTNQVIYVDAVLSPVKISGDGVISNNGKFVNGVAPEGLIIANGSISGTPLKVGTYPITLKAINCFGLSPNKTFNIVVKTNENLTPFEMDKYHFLDTSTNICALPSPNTSIFYYNGEGAYPIKGDTIYQDCNGLNIFIGGDKWYYANYFAIQIASNGTVIDFIGCVES